MPVSSPGDLPDPGIEPRSPALQADSLPAELGGKLGSYISTVSLNVNGLNAPTKRHSLAEQMKTCAYMHFHLHITLLNPPIVCNYIVRLIVFPYGWQLYLGGLAIDCGK